MRPFQKSNFTDCGVLIATVSLVDADASLSSKLRVTDTNMPIHGICECVRGEGREGEGKE